MVVPHVLQVGLQRLKPDEKLASHCRIPIQDVVEQNGDWASHSTEGFLHITGPDNADDADCDDDK